MNNEFDVSLADFDEDYTSEFLTLDVPDALSSTSDIDVDISSLQDVTKQEGFEYPAIVLSNVILKDALDVLQSTQHQSVRMVDAWIQTDDGEFTKIGKLEVSSTVMLAMRYLGIRAILYGSADYVECLDCNDPHTLEGFI